MSNRVRRAAGIILPWLFVCSLGGCTLFPYMQPTPLNKTTSAERVNQILFEDVGSSRFDQAGALLAPNAVWETSQKRLLGKDDILQYLQGLGAGQVHLSATEVRGNPNTITVLYTLQWNANGATVTRRMASVWERSPGEKPNSPYLMILTSEQPSQQ